MIQKKFWELFHFSKQTNTISAKSQHYTFTELCRVSSHAGTVIYQNVTKMFMKLHFILWMNVVYDFAKYCHVQLKNFKQYNHLNPQFCLWPYLLQVNWNFLQFETFWVSFIQKYPFKFYSTAFIFTVGLLNWIEFTNKKKLNF